MTAHGTYAGYRAFGPGCCEACNAAGAAYSADRSRRIAYGTWNPYVDAAPARAHVQQLQAAGLGWRRIAELAGVSRNTVNKLIYGTKGRPPTRRVRHETAEKILAVTARLEVLCDHARVDVTGTRRRLQALVALGWSQTKLAEHLGMDIANFNAMFLHRPAVLAERARAVRALYDQLWNSPPPETTAGQRQAASRSRAYAAERGWPLPMDLDDDRIDDPDAEIARSTPDTAARPGLPSGDELLWLVRMGETDEALADRFGTSARAVQQARYRAAKKQKEAVAA